MSTALAGDAQELEPRAHPTLPEGLDSAVLVYQFSSGNVPPGSDGAIQELNVHPA